MDISDFYQTFFDEADELLADMEQHLLDLNPESPDKEQLNAIFRAAHSIKGGAGTFGFSILQQTTHLMENLLDEARRGEIQLNTGMINLFLETKDIMQEQIDAYKSSQQPDAASYEYICQALRQLALEAKGVATLEPAAQAATPIPAAVTSSIPTVTTTEPTPASVPLADTGPEAHTTPPIDSVNHFRIVLNALKAGENDLLLEELNHLGQVSNVNKQTDSLTLTLNTSADQQDIVAVLCFVIEAQQIAFYPVETPPEAPLPSSPDSAETAVTTAATDNAAAQQTATPVQPTPAPSAANIPAAAQAATPPSPIPAANTRQTTREQKPAIRERENTSIRVAVEKVDQLINQVGELVITQSMLQQLSGALDPISHGDLLSSMSQLQRNARDLQESVMSIRMMPMEYVFSRFPRLVRDLASKLDKQVELTLQGSSTELDKSLIERIIDPLTHLVRNSLDHGIEMPEQRLQQGKPAAGKLVLSAEHQGGSICIEVTDDGVGLNRERIIAKAQSQGMAISENMSDDEVWMLIFAPGFSTAEKVTDVSGRGVGMDVVKRNIQEMGGHVEIQSTQGKGTRIRILLPLTLAILDGMSVKVSHEVFILPLNAVMESLQPRKEDLHPLTGGEYMLEVRGEYLPLVELWKVFAVQGAKTDATQGIVVILQVAGCRYALQVDQLIGQHQVVVKNLESNYRKVSGISAATILGDGSVALIVDVAGLPELNREQQSMARSLNKTVA